MKFEFATANRIIFGAGKVSDILPVIPTCNQNICVITGKNLIRAEPVTKQLEREKIDFVTIQVDTEPTVENVNAGVNRAREAGCGCVVGIGGGSVLDTGKVIAALLTNEGEIFEYLEVIGKGNKLVNPSVPYIAIPTTAGTGAEVTRNAVLTSLEHKVKVSMRSPFMLPFCAIIDPLLTLSMPKDVTAYTGLDAMTQLIEAYVSNKANPLTDSLCREGLKLVARSLSEVYINGKNKSAREDMACASLFGGLGLANSKLGAVHGFAGPLGGNIHAPHGSICGCLLPFVMEANIKELKSKQKSSIALFKYNEMAKILTGNEDADLFDCIVFVRKLCEFFGIPNLAELGLSKNKINTIVEQAQRASSMKGNPVLLPYEELQNILTSALTGKPLSGRKGI
jgi:alcohol dehydrogenase class IV